MIDAILSLSMVTIIILIYAGLVSVHDLNRRVIFRAQAAAIADEEVNAIKRLDVSTLTDQTNGAFINVLYNAGNWGLTTDSANLDGSSNPCPPPTSGLHCGANVLQLSGSTGISGTSGRFLFPAGAYGDATLQASWKVFSDSPAGWGVGFLFRTQDNSNTYRLRVAATGTDLDPGTSGTQNFVLDKIVGGTSAVIFSKASVTFSTNTWNSLKVVLVGSSIKTYVNGNQQDSGALTDTAFTTGPAALLGWAGVHAEVDDVQTITTATSRWNFEGAAVLPAAWTRLGLNDLPDGTPKTFEDNGLLTIAPYPNTNSTTLKKITINIQWKQAGSSASYTTSALVGKSSLGR